PIDNDATEPGFLHIEEAPEDTPPETSTTTTQTTEVKQVVTSSSQAMERAGTVEHLAARRPTPELDTNSPQVKQQLSELRTEVTRLLTALRWEGLSVEETTERLIPLLNVGSVQQWKSTLIPYLLEIDRAGNLLPVWLKIIDRGDPRDLPPDMNPAETMEGRARRFAIIMLGNYRNVTAADSSKSIGFSRSGSGASSVTSTDLIKVLGKLATDPNASLYATQSLVKQATTSSIETLVSALKDAEGWAKVDVVEGILALNLARFNDLLLASGLDRVTGLESYVAIPIYRAIPLEDYLNGDNSASPRLAEQAALIFNQVLLDSMAPPTTGAKTLPAVFERNLPTVAQALFEGARRTPTWQKVIALHRLGILLGRYWSEISRRTIQDPRILEPVYGSLPMMNEVERWMGGPGRDVLLDALTNADAESLTPIVKVLGELREPRATAPLMSHIEKTNAVTTRSQALTVAAMCDTLGRLGDRRATSLMLQLVQRCVDVDRRSTLSRRRDNLPFGDAEIPGSIVYAAVIRACGQLSDPGTLDSVLRATGDFDPYVRAQALEAMRTLDPAGNDTRSRTATKEALVDPRDSIVRTACQIVVQYRDLDSVPALRYMAETRPELAHAAHDALRKLGQ
ncbi:MAG: HEAT repeat domain-containing protein, partial [Chloroflexi bacterium]|nr:HEAT repeat domain-containing protein [Chloroflexota bacterium]